MRPQPLIAVRDAEASSRWYPRLLDCKSGNGGKDYEQLLYRGERVMQLHAWDVQDDEHPHTGRAESKPYGNGVLLWFQVESFDAAVARAGELGAEILEEPHTNPNAGQREVWLRDPDGHVVVIASLPGA